VSFVCTKFCDNKEDAEEIVQDTFVIAFKKVDQLRGDTLLAYLRKIAVHECFRRRKVNNRRTEQQVTTDVLLDDMHELDKSLLPEDALLSKEWKHQLLVEINQLPRPQRESVYLYYYIGLNVHEIANIMESNLNYVYANLSRARKVIKRKLEKDTTTPMAMKVLVLLPLAALFVAEETVYVTAGTAMAVGASGAAAYSGVTSSAAVAGSGSVVGYVAAACTAFVLAATVTFYIALQPEPEILTAYAEVTSVTPVITTIPTTTPLSTTQAPTTPPPITMPEPTEPLPTTPVTTLPTPTTAAATPAITQPPPPPTPTDRTQDVLAALANAHTHAAVSHILEHYDFAFDTQIHTMAGVRINFYLFNEGSGDVMVGLTINASDNEWRMRYLFAEGGQVRKDNVDLYIWMRN